MSDVKALARLSPPSFSPSLARLLSFSTSHSSTSATRSHQCHRHVRAAALSSPPLTVLAGLALVVTKPGGEGKLITTATCSQPHLRQHAMLPTDRLVTRGYFAWPSNELQLGLGRTKIRSIQDRVLR